MAKSRANEKELRITERTENLKEQPMIAKEENPRLCTISKYGDLPKEVKYEIAEESGKGRGFKILCKMPRKGFIGYYCGRIYDSWEQYLLISRGAWNMQYIMKHDSKTKLVDGSEWGNDIRFINHSNDPNCFALWEDHEKFPRIYALRPTKPGEFLSLNYNVAEKHQQNSPHRGAFVTAVNK
jgi:SET domain